MKRAAIVAVLAVALLVVRLNALAQVTDRELPVGGATMLRLNVSGAIHVIPVAGLTTIKFHVVDNGPSVPPMSLSTTRAGARLNVSINGPSENILPFVGASGYELQLQYPANMRLDLRENAGRIHVERVPVPMQLYNEEGNIVVDDASAQLTAYAVAGDVSVTSAHTSLTLTVGTGNVDATLARGWRGSLVRLEASNGNLHLVVPAGFKARYDVTSGSGRVTNPLHSVPKAPLVFMLTETGDASIATL